MRYDPGQDLKKLKCPVLALNGEKDIQVDAAMNLAAIQERITGNGNKNVTVKAYPNLNHLFQTCEKEHWLNTGSWKKQSIRKS